MIKYYWCKTQEEYNWLMGKLEEEGYRWEDKSFPTEDKAFKYFEGDTIVEANGEDKRLVYADVEYYLVEEGKGPADFILVSELMKEEGRHSEDNFNALDPCRILIKQPTESEEPLVVPLPFKPAPILNRYQVEGIASDLEEKQSRQVVYLVQKTPLINKGVKTTDGVFRTFQAAEKHILDQGGRPLGFFCYESTELGFEIEQFEVLEVEE